MTIVYLSVVAVFVAALGVAGYARRRPAPVPAPAEPITITELFEIRAHMWDSRTPLGELEAPTLHPWPEDEAAELLAAWRDERAAV